MLGNFLKVGWPRVKAPLEAMYRELREEVGLDRDDVEVLGSTKRWLKYRLPKQYLRHGSIPWLLVRSKNGIC